MKNDETVAFIDIFTTQNDLYGKNNCPIQFCCEIFKGEEMDNEEGFLIYPKHRKVFNIIPDEHIMPLGTLISGISNEDIKTSDYNGYDLKTSLEKIYSILTVLRDRGVYIVGFNHIAFDLRILNEHFKRILSKEPIVFENDRLVDLYKICENNIEVTEIGSYSMDSVYTYLFGEIQRLLNLRMKKHTTTDIRITKMILRKMLLTENGESLEEFVKRMAPKGNMTVFNFGKYKGARISDIIKTDNQYVSWILNNKTFREQSPHIIESINNIVSSGV